MQDMMHCLNTSVLERQRFHLQQQKQQQQEIINNFSLENFSSLQGEGLGGEGWPNLTSTPQYAIDLRQQQQLQFLTPPPIPTTTTTTISNSTTSIQVGKEKTTTGSSKKRKSPIVASDDEEKRTKGDKRNEREKQHGNKRKYSANNSKENTDTTQDYIHVRARRGQATASHSLAERVRRERISEKMKYLQDLVPGCNKITGKAGMLDEIIKYVQSLQRQVEFLSMKLAAVNPRLDFNMEALITEEMNLRCNSNISMVTMSPEMVDHSFLQFCSTPYNRQWLLAALTQL